MRFLKKKMSLICMRMKKGKMKWSSQKRMKGNIHSSPTYSREQDADKYGTNTRRELHHMSHSLA